MAVVEGTRRHAADVVGNTTHDLYRLYGKQIYAYCFHRLRSREEAEDAVQTTFMNAFRALQRGATTQYEQAWLFKIAQNVCIARSSSSARRLSLEAPNDFEVLQEVVPAQGGERPVELIGVEEALEQMPENQRRAILLREWQGLSYREIGEELGVSQAAVEMLIFRARRALAGALEQPGEKKAKVGRKVGSLGSLLGALKTLLGGGAAIKAAAVAAAAIAVVGESAQHTIVHHVSAPRTRVATAGGAVQATAVPAPSHADVRAPAVREASIAAHPESGGRGPLPASHPATAAVGPKAVLRVRPDESAHAPAPAAAAAVPPPVVATPVPAPAPTVTTTAAAPPPAPVVTTTAANVPPAPSQSNSPSDKKKDKEQPPAPVVTTTAANVPPAPPQASEKQRDKKKDKEPQPTLVTTPPATTTTATTATPAPTPPPAAPADSQQQHGNDGDHGHKGKSDPPPAPPAITTPVVTVPVVTTTTPAVTTPASTATVPAPADHGHGNGNGSGKHTTP